MMTNDMILTLVIAIAECAIIVGSLGARIGGFIIAMTAIVSVVIAIFLV